MDVDGVVVGVGWLQADAISFAVQSFERSFAGVQQGDDDLAVAGGVAILADDVVPVANVVVDHAVARDAQDEGVTIGWV